MTDPNSSANKEIIRIEKMIGSGEMKRQNKTAKSTQPAVTPKNAASIILVKGKPGHEKIVMGKRNMALKFMPGALVFPGGRVDPTDGRIKAADNLHKQVEQKLLENMRGRPRPSSAHGVAIAAIRELAEETGLLIGKPTTSPPKQTDFKMFADKSLAPSIGGLRLLARAITPPGNSRRFDTWFFVHRLEDDHSICDDNFTPSGELENLSWISPQETFNHDTREITRVILVELMARLRDDHHFNPNWPVPCYITARNRFKRSLM